jgi:putative ABC transport system permease protein
MTPGELLRRLRYLLLRDRYTAELEEEMRLHRQLRAERLQGGGLSPTSARYAAQRKFGNTTHHQERSRDMWGMQWIENAAADLRFAARRLRSRPGFAISTILVAALGIGATTAVFSAVDAAILRPLPFHKPHELVALPNVNVPFDFGPGRREPVERYRYLDVTDFAGMRDVFTHVAAYAPGGLNLEDATAPRRVRVGVVTANFFTTLGVSPARGRVFSPEEGKPRGPRRVILSDALWRSQYSARDSIIGSDITLHGNRYEVIGVMPKGFGFPSESDLWIPLSLPATSETFSPFRGYLPTEVVARMAPGVTADVAARRLQAKWEMMIPPPQPARESSLAETIVEMRGGGAAVPLQDSIVASRKKGFYILLGATALLLLIASANVANLLLSDGAGRRREVAVREVLGATRGRLIRQLLVESILLAVSGALLGVAVAPLALGLMRPLMPPALAGTSPIHLDFRVLGFAAALAVVTGTIFGLWPALGASRVDAGEAIKSGGGHGATSGRLGSARRVLITAEVALTVMLLVGSGLMLKSFHRLVTQDFGMRTDNVGTLELSFVRPGVRMPVDGEAARRAQVVSQILERIKSAPGVSAVGVINDLPLRGGGGIAVGIDLIGAPKPEGADFPRYLIADGGYFAAMGIPLLAGRTFNTSDDTVGQRSAVISRAMADAYWPNSTALGRSFYWGGDTAHAYSVVGIVADVREGKADQVPGPQVYFSTHERTLGNIALVARGTIPPERLLGRMQNAVREVVPTQAIYNLRTMEDVVAKSVAPRRTNTLLIAVFGALALILSAFGVYAVVSYSVTQRSREFGIRSALGAERGDILSLVTGDMARLLAIGLVIGLGGAWALARVLASLLYEVDAHDPGTFVVVPIVLMLPVALATLIPSLRATRVSPTEIMRAE